MRIIDLLSPEKIALGASAADKEGAIDLLVDLQSKSGCLTDRETYKQAILARESQTSTAIEMGIAVPHAKSACVKSPSLAACILKDGVDYGAMDCRSHGRGSAFGDPLPPDGAADGFQLCQRAARRL